MSKDGFVMRSKMFVVLGLVGAGFVAGCGGANKISEDHHVYYSQTRPSISKISSELEKCAIEATQIVPPKTVIQSSPIVRTPIQCNKIWGQTSCTGGAFGGQISSYDANDNLRENVRLACLERADVYKTMIKLPACPLSIQDGGLAGWFNGQLTAAELAHLKVVQWREWGFNSTPDHIDPTLKTCLNVPSMDSRHAGTTNRLSSFPEHFVLLRDEIKSMLVNRTKNSYRNLGSGVRDIIGSDTFSELTALMQATIDFCSNNLNENTYMQIISEAQTVGFDTPNQISLSKVCDEGQVLF